MIKEDKISCQGTKIVHKKKKILKKRLEDFSRKKTILISIQPLTKNYKKKFIF